MSTLMGSPLIAMPSAPGPREVEWTAVDSTSAVTSPYTGQQQVQSWGGAWLAATVTLPPMQRANAAAWIAFLLAAQGMGAVFMFGDGLQTAPQGTAQGAPVTVGDGQYGNVVYTQGWSAGQANLLLAGDCIQIGFRLYRLTAAAASDGSGNASLSIWPAVRESPPAGSSIVTTDTQGLFRLAGPSRRWSESFARTYGLSFGIREAI